MQFIKKKTKRGFALVNFQDDYGVDCNVQISSAVEPHIWLGVPRPDVLIRYKDAKILGLDLVKRDYETNQYGWCEYPIPKEALIESRMHLNKKQSFKLAIELLKFAIFGWL